MKNKTYYIALYGIMFAAIFVAMMLDRLISLALPISTAACVLLITFSFCFIKNDWLIGFFSGLFFGVASLIKGIIFNAVAVPIYFAPLLYIVPRLFVGIGAFAVYKLFLIILKDVNNQTVKQVISLVLGTLIGLCINTVLYLLALNGIKLYMGEEYTALFTTIKIVIFTNILPEYLISLIFVPILVLRTRVALHLGIEGRVAKIEE
ncbi:MAG: hypothetical protein RR248_00155 [Clostridia bacterium]